MSYMKRLHGIVQMLVETIDDVDDVDGAINEAVTDIIELVGECPHDRLKAIRESIEAENVSWGELAELQGLTDYIEDWDVLLLEWAGVPEFKGNQDLIVPRVWKCPQCGGGTK